jgi:hypothetical protein
LSTVNKISNEWYLWSGLAWWFLSELLLCKIVLFDE